MNFNNSFLALISKEENHFKKVELASEILGNLGPWILSDDVLNQSGKKRAVIPDTRGSCLILCVWKDGLGKKLADENFFNQAFALPLLWVSDKTDSKKLPPDFLQIAKTIKIALNVSEQWGLIGDSDLNGINFSEFNVTASSSFSSLAAGLILAQNNLPPKTNVFSTGCWSQKGITFVEGVAHKINTVKTLCTSKAIVFVPHTNINEAEQASNFDITIKEHPHGNDDLLESLGPYLAQLAAPPSCNAPLEAKLKYANLPFIIKDYQRRTSFYKEHLIMPLAKRLKNSSRVIKKLAVGVSHSWWLTAMVIAALEPEECFFLCTDESKKYEEKVKAFLNDKCQFQTIFLKSGGEEQCLIDIHKWLKNSTSGAVEITAGTKEMSTLLTIAAIKTKAKVYYLRHELVEKTSSQKYGTEQIVELPWVE